MYSRSPVYAPTQPHICNHNQTSLSLSLSLQIINDSISHAAENRMPVNQKAAGYHMVQDKTGGYSDKCKQAAVGQAMIECHTMHRSGMSPLHHRDGLTGLLNK